MRLMKIESWSLTCILKVWINAYAYERTKEIVVFNRTVEDQDDDFRRLVIFDSSWIK